MITRRYALMMALISATFAAHAFQNEPNGFRGLSWGSDLTPLLGELNLVEESGQTKVYTRPSDKLSIGAASIKRIAYGFESDKLTSVIIESEGYPNNTALLQAFSAQFGTPIRPNRFMDKYHWKGKATTIMFNCNLSLNTDCTAYLLSSESVSSDKTERDRKAKNSADDF